MIGSLRALFAGEAAAARRGAIVGTCFAGATIHSQKSSSRGSEMARSTGMATGTVGGEIYRR